MVFAETSLFAAWASILFLVAWVLIAFWPARVASRKGHSFIGYFFLSLLFFPLALIIAYAVRDRRHHGGPGFPATV